MEFIELGTVVLKVIEPSTDTEEESKQKLREWLERVR